MTPENIRQRMYAKSPFDLATEADDNWRNAVDQSLEEKIPVLDNLATTLYHHRIAESPDILVIEQHFKTTGIIEYTLKMKHFDSYVEENPIRLYTNTPVWN